MKQSQKIAKNAAFGILGAGLGGVLNVVSVLIAAHMLKLTDFGAYSYLLAFATVFQFICDFGLSNILVREIARRPHDQELLLGSVKTLFWFIFVIAVFILGLVAFFLPVTRDMKLLSWIMGIGYLWMLHSVGYLSVLRANQENEFNSIGFVIHKILLVIFIWSTLTLGFGLLGVVVSNVVANFLQWLYYHIIVLSRHSSGRLRFEPALWKALLIESIPMGGGVALRQITWQVDIFVAASLMTPAALGLFSGPFRLLVGITLISSFIAVPLFPVFAKLFHQAPDELEVLYQRTVKWFCLIGFPIMAVCFSWPEVWVNVLLGKHFQAAIPAFQILSLSVVSIFISVLYPYIYCAIDRQFDYFVTMVGAVVIRVLANIVVIPIFGLIGACWNIAIIETALFFALCWRLKALGYAPAFAQTLLKPAAAGVLAALILSMARFAGPVWMAVSAVLAGSLYLALLAWSEVLSPEELSHARDGLGFLKPYLKSMSPRAQTEKPGGVDLPPP